jgi:hypothetical protein
MDYIDPATGLAIAAAVWIWLAIVIDFQKASA